MQLKFNMKAGNITGLLLVLALPLSQLQAHDSIAASYVVPDDELVWLVYDPDVHGDLSSNDLTFLPGWYAGLGGGSTEVAPEGSSGGFFVEDDRDWGFKIFVGRRFFPHWSGEVSFVDTGEAGLSNNNPSIAATLTNATISYKIPTISGSYHLFGPKKDVDVFGRVGLSAILNTVSDERITYEKQTPLQLNIGGGVQWRFAPKWFLRAEFDSFDNDASFIGLSIGRYIGRHDEHRIIEPKALVPVVEVPEPVVVEPVMTVETCAKFNGSIDDIRFEVNSAVIVETSYPLLIEASENLKQFPEIVIEVQAHSDSTASDSYNLELSERRAGAIKEFLVQQGIDSERIVAKGYGESQPRASNETAEGRALNRRVEFKLIDNLACE
ncbi:OmpA family protein [Reinekea sp.]|jgi:outer membrane protein OmpA-like peptidoglycan-associated protein|uniref:OmpA family protein n=1 Tax=Reinekea sp. TaxID=1970455 RepID=UPI003989C03F